MGVQRPFARQATTSDPRERARPPISLIGSVCLWHLAGINTDAEHFRYWELSGRRRANAKPPGRHPVFFTLTLCHLVYMHDRRYRAWRANEKSSRVVPATGYARRRVL